MTDRENQRLIGMIFPFVGLASVLLATVLAVSTNNFINTASKADGKVVRLTAGGAHPVVQFVPISGEKPVEFPAGGMINYKVGDQVTVLYVKDSQNSAGLKTNIDNPGALWFLPTIFGSIGGVMTICGLQARAMEE
jgi:hypothetical protein